MTGNLVLDLAISLGGIAFIVFMIRWLFPLTDNRLTLEKAAERLAFDEPDFKPEEWLIDKAGANAIAINSSEAMLFRLNGSDIVTRRGAFEALDCTKDGALLTVTLKDPTFPPLRITAPDEDVAGDWFRELNP